MMGLTVLLFLIYLHQQGRVKIKAANNIFFDINDSVISLESACEANGATFSPSTNITANEGDAILNLTLSPQYGSIINSFSGDLETSDSATSLAAEAGGSCVNYNLNVTYGEAYTFQVDQAGIYTFSKNYWCLRTCISLYDGSFIPSSPCTIG